MDSPEEMYADRVSAIHLLRSGSSPAEVAEQLSRSLSWVYKWRRRFRKQPNRAGLQSRSRAPHRCGRRLPEEVRQAIRQTRSELETEATEPGHLTYIGAHAVRARLKRKRVNPLPSVTSIERVLRAAGMTRPRRPQAPAVVYPRLHPHRPLQLVQVDITPHFLPGGRCVSCFNAIDVISRYPSGRQLLRKRAVDAVHVLVAVWQELGVPTYTQLDNEGCFSGGATHPGVLGQVVRLGLLVGTELVFSPVRNPKSNGTVERFHGEYSRHVWNRTELQTLEDVQSHSAVFLHAYRHSDHHRELDGHCPAELHQMQPARILPLDFCLPEGRLPLMAGRAHFMRRVDQDRSVSVLNMSWPVPAAQPDQGVWVTLTLTSRGATLHIYDAAPDATTRVCLAQHRFPLNEPVQPNQHDGPAQPSTLQSWLRLPARLVMPSAPRRLLHRLSTML